jgi:hypothetical protein
VEQGGIMVQSRVIVVERAGVDLIDDYVESDPTVDELLVKGIVTTSTVLTFEDTTNGSVTLSDTLKDELSKVSSNDSTAGYLNGKLVAGTNISLVENNDGGNETLTISASGSAADELVKVTGADTTAGYLFDKVVGVLGNIDVSVVTDSVGDQTLQLDIGSNVFDVSTDTTDILIEGTTNLFFTDERVDDRVANLLIGGTSITLTYDDSAGSITIDNDFAEQVRVSVTDATPEYLEDKIVSGTGITVTTLTDSFGTETLEISSPGASTDELVKVTSNDTTPGYLFDKLIGATGKIVLTELNDGGDEDLEISLGADVFDTSVDTSDDITEGVTNLFFTEERVDDRVAALLIGGTSISISYDDSAGSITIDNDFAEEVRVSGTDITPGFLEDKIVSGTGITTTVLTDSFGFETLEISASGASLTDELVKVTSNDTTPGYLFDKLVGASGKIVLTELGDGGDEDLEITLGGDVFDKAVDDTDDITEGVVNLFYTDERVDDRVAALLIGGDSITISYDDSAGSITIDNDFPEQVRVSFDDSLPGYLEDKVIAGTGISVVTLTDSSGFETLEISSPGSTTDELVGVSATDTAPGYLSEKLISSTGAISFTTVADSFGDEDLDLDVDESLIDHDVLLNFISSEHVDHSTVSVVAGGDDALAFTNNDLTSNIGLIVDIVGTTSKSTVDSGDWILIQEGDSFGALRSITFSDFTSSFVTTDELVGASSTDTVPGYLNEKLISSTGAITFTIVSDSFGDEDVDLDVDESFIDHDTLFNFVANEHVDHSTVSVVAGGEDALSFSNNDLTSNIGLSVDIIGTSLSTPISTDFILYHDVALGGLRRATVSSVVGAGSSGYGSVFGDTGSAIATTLSDSISIVGSPFGGIVTDATDGSVDSLEIELDISDLSSIGSTLSGTDELAIDDGTAPNVKISVSDFGSQISNFLDESVIDHDTLLNFVADEHVAHSSVSVVAGGDDALAFTNNDLTSNIGLIVDIVGTTSKTTVDSGDWILVQEGDSFGALRSITFADFTSSFITTDELVGVSATDATPGYLEDKLVSSSGEITFVTVTDSFGDQTFDLSVDESTIDHDALLNFVADEHVAHSSVSVVAGGDDALAFSNNDLTSNIGLIVDIVGTTSKSIIDSGDWILIQEGDTAGLLRSITFADFTSSFVTTDELVKVTSNDTTPDYLFSKIIGTTGKIVVTEVNDGGDEDLQINVGADVFDTAVDDTDDITEGTTNLFYTDERVDDRVSSLLIGGTSITINYDDSAGSLTIDNDFAEQVRVTSNDTTPGYLFDKITGTAGRIVVTEVNDAGDEDLNIDIGGNVFDTSTDTTDDITEGVTNLFFTDERVDDRVAGLLIGGTSITLSYDDSAGSITIDNDFAEEVKVSSDDAVPGFLEDKIISGTGITVTTLTDSFGFETLEISALGSSTDELVKVTSNDTTPDYLFGKVTGTSGKIVITEVNDGGDEDLNINIGGDIFDTAVDDTDDITEGTTNLFYTDERVDDRVANLLVGGTSITLSYDDSAGSITIDNDFAEQVRVTSNDTTPGYLFGKIIGTASRVTISEVNDAGDEDLQINVDESGIDHDSLLNFVVDEHVAHSGVSVVAGGDDALSFSNNDLSSNIGLSVDIIGTTVETVNDDDDLILIHDVSASSFGELRSITRADFLSGISGADELVKVSANDTTAGFLNGKLVAGTGIDLTENNDGGNETLTVSIDNNEILNRWSFNGGYQKVGSNSTKGCSWGNDSSDAGISILEDGEVIGISCALNEPRTAGTLTVMLVINGVAQNGAGQTFLIDATNTTSNELVYGTPIVVSQGDIVSIQGVSSGFSPNASDPTMAFWGRDT